MGNVRASAAGRGRRHLGRILGRLAGGASLCVIVSGPTGCSLAGLFDDPPIEDCTPGTLYAIPCGLCGAGDGLELCLDDLSRVFQSCDDPDDHDGDHWSNTECGVRRPGCAGCSMPADCDDDDATVNPAATERCNGIDDDCDGDTDETFACAAGLPAPCRTTCGSTGTATCTETCTPAAAVHCSLPTEQCNGADDDCDGDTDEDFRCIRGASVTCTTTCGWSNVGTCTEECAVPEPEDCPPRTEICNGVDDDCDDLTDEGC